jgi:hypothetical protein
MFINLPLCEGDLSREHKERLEALLGNLSYFLNTPGDWGYDTQLGTLCTAIKITLHKVRSTQTE